MNRDAELAHLNSVAGWTGASVEIDGDGYVISHPASGRSPRLESLGAVGLVLGGMLNASAELQAAAAVASARYGSGSSRAQRRADAKRQRRAGGRHE